MNELTRRGEKDKIQSEVNGSLLLGGGKDQMERRLFVDYRWSL